MVEIEQILADQDQDGRLSSLHMQAVCLQTYTKSKNLNLDHMDCETTWTNTAWVILIGPAGRRDMDWYIAFILKHHRI